MDRQKLLKRIVFLMLFIFFAELLSWEFHLYYSVWWFDILMHFSGGFWVGLFFLYTFLFVFDSKSTFFNQCFAVLFGVLVIGVLWEIFEFWIASIAYDTFDMRDSLSDIFFDVAGGLSAMFYASKRLYLGEKIG